MLHSWIRPQEEIDSQLLVVGSQIASLTPRPSFAHNLGCRCPNGSCKAILDIYSLIPFQWHKERIKKKRFDPSNRLLSFRKSRRTPSLPLLGVGIAFSHFAQSGVATSWAYAVSKHLIHWLYLEIVLDLDQWYDAMGVWSCSSTINRNGAPFIIYIGLPFPIPVHIIVQISFVIVLWKLHYWEIDNFSLFCVMFKP